MVFLISGSYSYTVRWNILNILFHKRSYYFIIFHKRSFVFVVISIVINFATMSTINYSINQCTISLMHAHLHCQGRHNTNSPNCKNYHRKYSLFVSIESSFWQKIHLYTIFDWTFNPNYVINSNFYN